MGNDSSILVLGGPLGGAGLLLAVIAFNLGIVYINVLLNKWNNTFYDALQDKNYTVFLHQLIRFSWLAGLYIVFAVYQSYLNQMLQIRWRRWLTERYLRRWLTDGAYYRMQLGSGEADNPDQRVAEDVPQFIASTLNLSIGGMRAVVTLISSSQFSGDSLGPSLFPVLPSGCLAILCGRLSCTPSRAPGSPIGSGVLLFG